MRPREVVLPEAPAMFRLAVPGSTLRQFPWLRAALAPMQVAPLENLFYRPDAVAGWGTMVSAAYARRYARLRGAPYYTIMGGFYCSVGLGKAGAPPVSFILDRSSPNFDATRRSDLEQLLMAGVTAEVETRGRQLREFIAERRLSKYNIGADAPVHLQARRSLPRILLVDQVAGDKSLQGAGASHATFTLMREEAERRVRDGSAAVFLKAHPDVLAGYGKGMLGEPSSLLLPTPDANPHALLDEVDEVWTASSHFGFDALLRGKRVVVFAAPFYAGWGLTEDRAEAAAAFVREALHRRSAHKLTLDAMAGIAIGVYPRYYDPVLKRPCTPEVALERLAAWRDHHYQRKGRMFAVGFAWHKHQLIKTHLGANAQDVRFVRKESARTVEQARAYGAEHIIAWGDRLSAASEEKARSAGMGVWRVEDGFVRSRGLGRHTPPWSLCFDSMAAYFDATRPSELESLLETHCFSDAERARGKDISRRIVSAGITKYNLNSGAPDLKSLSGGRPIVLTIAQVPGDASWRLGEVPFRANLEFLAAVRAECPNAFLVFKEHPDLVAGVRPGLTDHQAASALADLVLTEGDAAALYGQADALHVMTSLAGFEGLLRNRQVVCWGAPFYAGWGLTVDRVACQRRTRRLVLEELVAGVLALYPTYLDPVSGAPCTVEDAIAVLAEPTRRRNSHLSPQNRRWILWR